MLNYTNKRDSKLKPNIFLQIFFYQVTSMTALKFAELAAKAGFPKGVINIVPGSGYSLYFVMTVLLS